MVDVSTPTALPFTEEDIAQDAARDDLPNDKHYRLRITEARFKVTDKGTNPGSHMFSFPCRALANPDEPEGDLVGPSVWQNLIVPRLNPDVPGHKKPKTAGLVAQFFRAIFPDDIPDMPYKNENGELEYNGEVIEKEDDDKCRQEVMAIVHDKIDELYEDRSIVVDKVFYCFKVRTADGYTNLKNIDYELKPDKNTGVMPEVESAESLGRSASAAKPAVKAKSNGKKNGAKGRAKPAKKTTKKKTRRRN